MILFIIGLLVMYFLSNVYFILYSPRADQQNMTPFSVKSMSTNQLGPPLSSLSASSDCKWVVVLVLFVFSIFVERWLRVPTINHIITNIITTTRNHFQGEQYWQSKAEMFVRVRKQVLIIESHFQSFSLPYWQIWYRPCHVCNWQGRTENSSQCNVCWMIWPCFS